MLPTDGDVVERAARSDEERVAELYDQHFDSLYDFCTRALGNAEAAAAATEETFRRALTSLGNLIDLQGFKVFLFSIAFNVVLEQHANVQRPTEESQNPVFYQVSPQRLADPEQTPLAQDIAGLVWEGASGLSLTDYAVLDLHLRQGLNAAEIAAALSMSRRAVQGRLEGLKRATERYLSSFIMARRGSRDCEGMRRLLLGLPIAATRGQLQRATERHLRSCPICATARGRMISPLAVLATLTPLAPAAELRESIRGRVLEAWRATAAEVPLMSETPLQAAGVGAALGDAGRGSKGPLASAVGALGDGWQRFVSIVPLPDNLVLPLGAALIVLAAAGGIAWGRGIFDSSLGVPPTPSPTATSTSAAFAIVTNTPTSTATESPTVAASPIAQATSTPAPMSPTPTLIPTIEASITPTEAPSPQATASPTATPSPMSTLSATPEPTLTPTPTP